MQFNLLFFSIGASWQFVNAAGPFPDKMVRGGVDADGSVIYVGRAFHNGDMIPAKVIPDKVKNGRRKRWLLSRFE